MSDTFTVYRVQPTPKTIQALNTGKLQDIGSVAEIRAANQKGMSIEEFNKSRSRKFLGKWWTPEKNRALLYNKRYHVPGTQTLKHGSELLKRKVHIDEFVEGWKKLYKQSMPTGSADRKHYIKYLDNKGKQIKKLFKTNKKEFFKSVALNETILDITDNAKTSIRGTWSINPNYAIQKFIGAAGSVAARGVLGAGSFLLSPTSTAEDSDVIKNLTPADFKMSKKKEPVNKYARGGKAYTNMPRRVREFSQF